jgi:hypothetical protein
MSSQFDLFFSLIISEKLKSHFSPNIIEINNQGDKMEPAAIMREMGRGYSEDIM